VRESDVQWQEELVTDLILAVPTGRRIIRIVKVATSSIHKGACPGCARLAKWWIECRKFVGLARYLQTAEG
jgi:hypothetical protein